MTLQQVGWLVWHKSNPKSKEFASKALTEADKRNGYLAEPVYTKVA